VILHTFYRDSTHRGAEIAVLNHGATRDFRSVTHI